MTDADTRDVHARMAAVVADLDFIPKGRSQGVSYEFRSIDALMNKLHGPLAAHGLYLSPQVLDDWRVDGIPGSKNRTQYQAVFRVQVTVYAADGSSTVLGPGLAQSHDYGDKAVYQAQQNAIKYLLLESFCIPVDEPDMAGRQPDESPAVEPAHVTAAEDALDEWAQQAPDFYAAEVAHKRDKLIEYASQGPDYLDTVVSRLVKEQAAWSADDAEGDA